MFNKVEFFVKVMSIFKIIWGPLKNRVVEVLQLPKKGNDRTVRISFVGEFIFVLIDKFTLSRWQKGIFGKKKNLES